MARRAVLEGGKRDEILNVALELFLINGYDGTSIRMILERVGGEVGMFYHYFQSKQEVFNKAFEVFMKRQGEQLSSLMSEKLNNMTPRKRLEHLKTGYIKAMSDYAKLSSNNIHWTVLSTLHEMTLEAMLPSFTVMLMEILQFAQKDNLNDIEWIAPFILKGISGLLHKKSFIELSEEKQMELIIDFLCRMLQIPKEIFS